MHTLERESVKFIPEDSHYIVKITISSAQDAVSNISSIFNLPSQPLTVYVCQSETNTYFYLLYSCVDELDEHFIGGNQQKLCCFYMKNVSRIFGVECDDIDIEIIELPTQTMVCMYFSYIVFETMSQYLLNSSTAITRKDIAHLTCEEVITKSGLDWENVSPKDKYGWFVKADATELSELFDLRKLEEYKKVLFS